MVNLKLADARKQLQDAGLTVVEVGGNGTTPSPAR
ncbi:MAG: hypothetical protein KatS3mg061_0661 [Dehalococcoidia bacterium]|nr:MAG: hypothetical protein KatS3mg061_0661 [Dehalococcoidia bacterium]